MTFGLVSSENVGGVDSIRGRLHEVFNFVGNTMTKAKVIYLGLDQLRHSPRNPRTHSDKQIYQIANSIEEFGFTNPIIIDQDNTVLAGNGRLSAAEKLGIARIPCIRLDHLTPAQKRAYLIADNKIAQNAGWDIEILADDFQLLLEDDYEIDITGFSSVEIDQTMDSAAPECGSDPAAENLPSLEPKAPVSREGDLWKLGSHRVYCGSAVDAASYPHLLGTDKAQMVFTDPPYNVRIDGHVSGGGTVKHTEFVMGSGEMTPEDFKTFLLSAFRLLAAHTVDGSIHYICMDWRHMQELLSAGAATYQELKNLCVWAKTNGGMGTFYRSRHELIFVFKNGTAKHNNNFELGQHGRYRTNVWSYAGMNAAGSERDCSLELHPTVKPVSMIADAIRDVTTRGHIVLDAFGGSGSTLIAAEQTGRTARVMELDPLYVDRMIRRWQSFAHDDAVLVGDERKFHTIAAERASKAKSKRRNRSNREAAS